MRNLKALALALVAVFALSAMAASAAQAENHLTTYNSATAKDETAKLDIKGVGKQLFRAAPEGEPVECEELTAHAEIAGGTATKVTATDVTYSKCKAFGLPATVTFNGCDYKLSSAKYIGTDEPAGQAIIHTHTGTVDLHCPPGKVVEIHVYTTSSHATTICTITVFPTTSTVTEGGEEKHEYSFGGHVIYGSTTLTPFNGKPNDIDFKATVTGIHAEEHGALCPDGNTTALNAGTYTGEATVTATNGGGEEIDVEITGTDETEV